MNKAETVTSALARDPVAQLTNKLGKNFEVIQSPNHNKRRGSGQGKQPTELLMHYTACEKERVVEHFMKPDNVSSHYLVEP